MSRAANSEMQEKGHRWFSFKIYVQTKRMKFPSGLICWDFNMYPELPGLSPDNDFLVMRTGNSKNTVLQILKRSWWFFFLRLWFLQSFTSSKAFKCLPLFLDCWKNLASKQDLFSEFNSKATSSQSWNMWCPTARGAKRLLSVSFSLIHNIPQCKEKHLDAYPTPPRNLLC